MKGFIMATDFRYNAAVVQDFREARRKADIQEVLARFTGQNTQLLAYDEVREKLKIKGSAECGLEDIPLDSIVGSVGRYADFTRDFLPREPVSESRWVHIKMAATDQTGLDPIEVYQIGEAYFVRDGNHRVSVARDLGATHIQAYVTEIRTRVPLERDTKPDELILKAEYAEFLEYTHLDELRPEADLSVTVPGQYPILAEHIEIHRYFMGLDFHRDIPYEEAVTHWFDTVYCPVTLVIRERGVLDSFPDRTEADLYLWLTEHRAALEKELGWQFNSDDAAIDLLNQNSPKPGNVVSRLGEKLLETISLDTLESGPPTGQWRAERLAAHRADRLFTEILVPLNGEASGWCAFEQALSITQKESARLRGLHVIPAEADRDKPGALAIQAEFQRRCQEAGVPGELAISSGDVAGQICDRARWVDLVVVNLAHPPPPQPLARLSSGFRTLLQRSPRPVLAVTQSVTSLNSALLAYDSSPKAEEALFVATYLAGQWKIPLVVLTVLDARHPAPPLALEHAQKYLEEHGVQAIFISRYESVAATILKVAAEQECDLLIMGGYGHKPVMQVVVGSTVDQVLRESPKPVLICR
jgi:nucleotide-binding universal stress UspA family protein